MGPIAVASQQSVLGRTLRYLGIWVFSRPWMVLRPVGILSMAVWVVLHVPERGSLCIVLLLVRMVSTLLGGAVLHP